MDKHHLREHPDESIVLRFLDGELTERDAASLRGHLDGCWQCRRNLGEWQSTIDAFLRLRESVEFASAPPPPNPWMPFDQLCMESRPVASSMGWWRLWKAIPVAAAVVVCVVAGVLVYHRPAAAPHAPPTTMSAPAPKLETSPRIPAPPIPVVSPPLPTPAPNVNAQSPLHSLVLAAQVLHTLGADLGEPVAIVPSPAHVIVRAHGLDPVRRQIIQDALAKIPGVAFENTEPQTSVTGRLPGSPASPQTSRPKLFEADLLKRLESASAMESFANTILDDSDAIAIRAHAIQSLTVLFSAQTQLSQPDRATIGEIISSHRDVLAKHVRSLSARLQPFLVAPDAPRLEPATLPARAIELDRLLNAAFAGAQISMTDSELAARIQSLLKELEQQ